SGVLVGQGIVLKTAVRSPVLKDSRRNEDACCDRHLSFCNQIVEHDRNKIFVAFPVLKHHDTSRVLRLILGWHVNPPVTSGAFENPALPCRHLSHLSSRHSRLLEAVRLWPIDFERHTRNLLTTHFIVKELNRLIRESSHHSVHASGAYRL